jgi:hypothetical protein
MLALLSPIFGILGSLLPSIVRIFERKLELKHEIELTKLKIDASIHQANVTFDTEVVKATSVEKQSLLDHDKSLDGGKYINTLRASIRPVITYTFFFVFLAVKIAAAYVMIKTGQSVPDMLNAVWDTETMALFSTIIAFWFGSRMIEKQDRIIQPQLNVTVSSISTPTSTKKK